MNPVENSCVEKTVILPENGHSVQPFEGSFSLNLHPFLEVNVGSDIGHTGRRHDGESGFQYFRARYYSAELGRFASRDLLWTALDVNWMNALNMLIAGSAYQDGTNLYRAYFVINNVDPKGKSIPWDPDVPFEDQDFPQPGSGEWDMLSEEAKAAWGDFYRNYKDMRDANVIGADKYFHCKANCEASKRGEIGRDIAIKISEAREWFDENVKGDSEAECDADRYANQVGRDGEEEDCRERCAEFRVNGLPDRY